MFSRLLSTPEVTQLLSGCLSAPGRLNSIDIPENRAYFDLLVCSSGAQEIIDNRLELLFYGLSKQQLVSKSVSAKGVQ